MLADESAAVTENQKMADGCLARHARAYRGGPSLSVAAGLRGQLERVVRARTAKTCRGPFASRPPVGT
jgi:hypothetical protein